MDHVATIHLQPSTSLDGFSYRIYDDEKILWVEGVSSAKDHDSAHREAQIHARRARFTHHIVRGRRHLPWNRERDSVVCRLEVVFSPPRKDLDQIPGMREDMGGWIYRVYDARSGKVVVSGSSSFQRGEEGAIAEGRKAALEKGFTQHEDGSSVVSTPRR